MRFACLTLLVLAAGARAEDVENPEFTSWSKHKKGTAVTLKSIVTIRADASEQTLTDTLVEVAADKVVVETRVTITVKGTTLVPNALRREIPKSVKLKKGDKKEDVAAGRPAGTFDEGTETLKIGGVEYKTRWFKYKTDANGRVTEGQMWLSADVPNLVVRSLQSAGGEVPTFTATDLVEIKKP